MQTKLKCSQQGNK